MNYETPYLKLRETHRHNPRNLTKKQKQKEIKMVHKRRVKTPKHLPDYISSYPDDSVPLSTDALLTTLSEMTHESKKLYEDSQKKVSTIYSQLLEVIAKAKIEKMTYSQLQNMIDQKKKTSLVSKVSEPLPTASKSQDRDKEVRGGRSFFSFEERFKNFVTAKVFENMEILKEKRVNEFHMRLNQMLEADINKQFTNAQFKQYTDS